MKLEVGKLYKLNFGKILFLDEASKIYIKEDSIFLLLDYNLTSKPNSILNQFKVLAANGMVGWIETGMNAETLFAAIS